MTAVAPVCEKRVPTVIGLRPVSRCELCFKGKVSLLDRSCCGDDRADARPAASWKPPPASHAMSAYYATFKVGRSLRGASESRQ